MLATIQNNKNNPLFLLFIIDAYLNKNTDGLPKGKMLVGIKKAANNFKICIHDIASQYADTKNMKLHAAQSAALIMLDNESFIGGVFEDKFITSVNSQENKNIEKCSIVQ